MIEDKYSKALIYLSMNDAKDAKEYLTLIGKSYAFEGFQFFFQGPNRNCPKNCKLYTTCQENLISESVYEVVEVTNREMKCPNDFHEEHMVLCKLKTPEIINSMENKDIYLGLIMEYHPIDCGKDQDNCPYYQYCQPSKLLISKGKIRIFKKIKKISDCSRNKHLSLVQVEKETK